MPISEYFGKSPFEILIKLKKRKKDIQAKKQKRDAHSAQIKKIEEKYGVDFNGYIPDATLLRIDPTICNGYEASYDMPGIFDVLNIKETDRFLDVGSGKGYAMYMFSQFPFSAIHGVEMSEELARISKENLQKIFPDDNRFNVFCENAFSFSRIDDYNYIYMYNPFPREVIEEFVEILKQSVLRREDKLTVIYQNPQKGSLFEQSGVFKTVLLKDGTAVFESTK